MRDTMTAGEPSEWVGRRPPEFTRWPTTDEERTHNFRKYLAGFPWIVVAEDKGGMVRYHCGIRRKVATVTHTLSIDHIERTTTKFSEALGYVLHSAVDGEIQRLRHHGQDGGPLRGGRVRTVARGMHRMRLQTK